MATHMERRSKRSDNTSQALRYQLEACRREAGLEGMVLADEEGLALAASGDADHCDEIAARLALVGARVADFAGVLLSAEGAWQVSMRRFAIDGSELYMCAIGGDAEPRAAQIDRSIGGCSRILSAA